MTASIEDVAKLAGVSIATVSRALRDLPDVAPATRDRVLAAAAELDYVASPFAARLASGRTKTVAVVVPSVNRWYFAEVISSVEATLRDAGYDLLLYNLRDESGRARFFDGMPLRKRVDAVLDRRASSSPHAEIEALQSLACPLGLVGLATPGFQSSRIDDVTAAARRRAVPAASLGHQRIGLIGGRYGHDPMRFDPRCIDRRIGYHRALRQRPASSVDRSPRKYSGIIASTAGLPRPSSCSICRIDRPRSSPRATRWPTARYASSADGVFDVPRDIALMGFDDHTIAEVMDLTTVRQPVADQADDVATRLLIDISADAKQPAGDVVFPTELIIRGSTEKARSVY